MATITPDGLMITTPEATIIAATKISDAINITMPNGTSGEGPYLPAASDVTLNVTYGWNNKLSGTAVTGGGESWS